MICLSRVFARFVFCVWLVTIKGCAFRLFFLVVKGSSLIIQDQYAREFVLTTLCDGRAIRFWTYGTTLFIIVRFVLGWLYFKKVQTKTFDLHCNGRGLSSLLDINYLVYFEVIFLLYLTNLHSMLFSCLDCGKLCSVNGSILAR